MASSPAYISIKALIDVSWFLQLLDKVTPSQWAAIGVLGSLVFGLLTYLTNLYFKIKEDRRKAARGE
ncbi:TPA: class II holin family protein [Escherichia coli]|nr:class II holin family protein [Escherichia coli]